MELTEMSAFYGLGVFTTGLGYLYYNPYFSIGTTIFGLSLIIFGVKYHEFFKGEN